MKMLQTPVGILTALLLALIFLILNVAAYADEAAVPALSATPVQELILNGHRVKGASVDVETRAPRVEGHPLTSVVVTQCNLIVAVYMTMPDGHLLRFDQSASIPSEQLMSMAFTATRSERIEVSCNETGPAGYEKHEPL